MKLLRLLKKSGLHYEVGPFSISMEDDYDAILQLLSHIRRYIAETNCQQGLLQMQLLVHLLKPVTIAEKVQYHN